MSKKITGDNDLRVQYQRELNEVHAPEGLKKRVKLAVNQAEEEKRGVLNITYVRWAAVVVVMTVVVLLLCLVLYEKRIFDEGNYNSNPVQLGTEGTRNMELIDKEGEGIRVDGLIITITDKTQEEVLGKELENVVVCDTPVVLSVNIISGYYQCFYENGEQRYIITSKMTNKEEFLEKLGVFFDEER